MSLRPIVRRTRVLLAIALSFFTASGCSTGIASGGEEVTAVETQVMVGAHELMARAEPVLPEQPQVVFAMSAERYWRLVADLLPPARGSGSHSVEEGADAEQMRRDIGALVAARFGVDLTEMRGLVLGFKGDEVGAVFFGDVKIDEERFEVEQVEGREVFVLGAEQMPLPRSTPLFAKRLDGGLAVSSSKEAIGVVGLAQEGEEPLATELDPSAMVAVKVHVDEQMGERFALPFPVPERVTMSLGEFIELRVKGSEEALDGISGVLAQQQRMYRKTLSAPYERRDEVPLAAGFGAVVVHHFSGEYLDAIKETREEGELRYALAIPYPTMHVMLPGVLAAAAVPAYERYMKRSKAAEAALVTQAMAGNAVMYFNGEQLTCAAGESCDSPWHERGEGGDVVPFEQKTFPGGTDVRIESLATMPVSGVKLPVELRALGSGAQGELEATHRALGEMLSGELYFKYVYTTGSETGAGAEATIQAMADFDGWGEPNHTVTIKLSVDADGQVAVEQAPVIEHELR